MFKLRGLVIGIVAIIVGVLVPGTPRFAAMDRGYRPYCGWCTGHHEKITSLIWSIANSPLVFSPVAIFKGRYYT